MGKYTQAVQDAKVLGARLRGFLSLADALESIDSLEQAATDTQTRVDAVRSAETQAKADLANVETALKLATEAAEKIRNDTQAMTGKAFAEAEKRVAQMLAEAKSKAEDLVSSAKATADKMVSEARALAAQALQERDLAAAAHAAMQREIDEAKGVHAELAGKIEEARVTIQNLLGQK